MALLKNPEVTALPSISNIKHASEPIKRASESTAAPTVTVKSTFEEAETDHLRKSHSQLEEHPVDVVRPRWALSVLALQELLLVYYCLPNCRGLIYESMIRMPDVVCQRRPGLRFRR